MPYPTSFCVRTSPESPPVLVAEEAGEKKSHVVTLKTVKSNYKLLHLKGHNESIFNPPSFCPNPHHWGGGEGANSLKAASPTGQFRGQMVKR